MIEFIPSVMSDSPVTSGGAIPDDAFKYPTVLKVHLLLNHTPPAHTHHLVTCCFTRP